VLDGNSENAHEKADAKTHVAMLPSDINIIDVIVSTMPEGQHARGQNESKWVGDGVGTGCGMSGDGWDGCKTGRDWWGVRMK